MPAAQDDVKAVLGGAHTRGLGGRRLGRRCLRRCGRSLPFPGGPRFQRGSGDQTGAARDQAAQQQNDADELSFAHAHGSSHSFRKKGDLYRNRGRRHLAHHS